MGWSSSFIRDLGNSTVEPNFVLRFNSMPDFVGGVTVISGGYNQQGPSIEKSGPTFRGVSVIPQTWNVSFGGFSVPICGDISTLFPDVRRGSLAELYVDLNGSVERVAIGQLRQIRGFGTNWTLEFVDLITAMTARASGQIGTAFDGNDPDEFSYFPLVGKEQTITQNWFSSGTTFPLTISVDDIRPFQDVETGGFRVAKIDNGSGLEFFVRYDSAVTTSAPAGVLNLSFVHSTIVTVYPGINGCKNAASGSKITSVGMLNGKTWEIFAKILLSRDGQNVNTYDKYKKLSNFGAFLNTNLFDTGDADAQTYIKSSDPSSVVYEWSYVFFSAWNNGIRTFVDAAAQTGQWPTWRQNSLSWRGCQDPDQASTIAAQINDKDIISIDNIDIFDPNNKSTFYNSKNIYGLQTGGTILSNSKSQTFGEAQFLPADSFKERDLKYIYKPDPNSDATNRLRCSIGDINRLFEWDTRLWSKIKLRVKMNYAKLTAGDIVEIKSTYLTTFKNSTIPNTIYRAMVINVGWSFMSSSCTLELAILLK